MQHKYKLIGDNNSLSLSLSFSLLHVYCVFVYCVFKFTVCLCLLYVCIPSTDMTRRGQRLPVLSLYSSIKPS